MIVSYSTVEDLGAGFRSRLFMPRWKAIQTRLEVVDSMLPDLAAIRALVIIGNVEPKRTIIGIEGPSFVVETCIPIAEFKQLSIGEKNDRVLDTIFESIGAAYAHFGTVPPPEIDRVWQETRGIGK